MGDRRVGRPTSPVLSRQIIAAAALDLLDESGDAGFTLARLASRLRVRPSALYNHVSGKEDIIAGVRELVSDRIDTSAFGVAPWDEAVKVWARSYRRAFAAHPPTIALLATLPLTGAARTVTMYERVAEGFRDAGWPEGEMLSVVVALESFILGSALDAVAPDDMFDPAEFEPEVPVLAQAYAARARARRTVPIAEATFELGLDAFVDGLTRRLESFTA